MLGANLRLPLYGEVSVMVSKKSRLFVFISKMDYFLTAHTKIWMKIPLKELFRQKVIILLFLLKTLQYNKNISKHRLTYVHEHSNDF